MDGVLRLPWNSLTQNLTYITRVCVHEISWKKDGLPTGDMKRTETPPYLWSHDICKRLRCSFNITMELQNSALDCYNMYTYLYSILKWDGYKEKTCQEQIHLLTCNPMTFVKHLDRYLGLPRNSLTQHLIDISWNCIHVIPWKLMVYQEETYKEKTHHLTCDPITSVKHLNGA